MLLDHEKRSAREEKLTTRDIFRLFELFNFPNLERISLDGGSYIFSHVVLLPPDFFQPLEDNFSQSDGVNFI